MKALKSCHTHYLHYNKKACADFITRRKGIPVISEVIYSFASEKHSPPNSLYIICSKNALSAVHPVST